MSFPICTFGNVINFQLMAINGQLMAMFKKICTSILSVHCHRDQLPRGEEL